MIATNKPELAVAAHRRALKGTPFEKCAECPGTCGKLVDEGKKMGCSRGGGKVIYITAVLAQRCDGSTPIQRRKSLRHLRAVK